MTDEKLPFEEGEENLDPDTSSDEELEQQPFAPDVQEAIPVADEAAAAPAPVPPPAPPPGPRIYPQQYTLLFANTAILVGCLTVWERSHVTGMADLYGFQSIGGAFVCALAAYCVFAGLVGLVRGGVNFFASLGAGFFALYFAIRSMVRVVKLDGFQYYGDLEEKLGMQEAVNSFVGQFGPGHLLCCVGGLVIIVLFFKAMFGGGKKEPAPEPRRRGRR